VKRYPAGETKKEKNKSLASHLEGMGDGPRNSVDPGEPIGGEKWNSEGGEIGKSRLQTNEHGLSISEKKGGAHLIKNGGGKTGQEKPAQDQEFE